MKKKPLEAELREAYLGCTEEGEVKMLEFCLKALKSAVKDTLEEIDEKKENILERWETTRGRGANRIKCNAQLELIDELKEIIRRKLCDVK